MTRTVYVPMLYCFQKNERRKTVLTYEDLRNELLDYYGTATGPFPAAWGDVLRAQRADHKELLELAREARIDTSGLEEEE